MHKIQALVLVVAAVFGANVDGATFPAGKCDTRHIDAVPIDFHKIAGYGKLNFLYGPEMDGIEKVDHADLVFTRVDENTYNVVNTRYFKDKTTDKHDYTHTLVDDVILEDGIDAGKPFHFHLYPLAKTDEDAFLFYRCTDSGRQPIDTRLIAAPAGKTISEASLKQLFDADKKYKFRGGFYKFPNELA